MPDFRKKRAESVAGVIFSHDRKEVLLIKRRDVPVWVLPGGGMELKESPEEGVIREVLEETGLSVKIKRKVGEYLPLNKLAYFTHLYECEIIKGSLQTGEETREIQFFSLENLPKYLPPPYLEWIEEAFLEKAFIKRPLYSVNYKNFFKFLCLHPILVGRFLLQRMGRPFNS